MNHFYSTKCSVKSSECLAESTPRQQFCRWWLLHIQLWNLSTTYLYFALSFFIAYAALHICVRGTVLKGLFTSRSSLYICASSILLITTDGKQSFHEFKKHIVKNTQCLSYSGVLECASWLGSRFRLNQSHWGHVFCPHTHTPGWATNKPSWPFLYWAACGLLL